MGPTSSGKTTIAEHFVHEMRKQNHRVIHFDGDEIRNFFGKEFGFKPENRFLVVKTLAYLANKSTEAGTNVVVSALTAHFDARDYVCRNVNNLIVGYVVCPIEVCAERDPKGLYRKAKLGEITTLIGYNSEYLPPEKSDIVLDTARYSPHDNSERIRLFLANKGYLNSKENFKA